MRIPTSRRSGATTASALDALGAQLAAMRWQPAVRTLPPYYDDPAHIEALRADTARQLRALDFVPEVLLSANAMKSGMTILKPLLAETGAPRMGKMVIGTVKGDIHDIGKNLVAMMMEGAGFEVVDLGINNAVEKYLDALAAEQPDILGMSALLTTTMPYMKVVIDTMKEKGLRDDYIVLVGGAPLNEEFGKAIGADAYCRDAAVAVETAKAFVARKHNQPNA